MFLIDVTEVRALPNRQLELTFEDGVHGTVEMDQILQNYSGVFEPPLEAEYFQQVTVDKNSEPSSGQTALMFAQMCYTHTPQGNSNWLMAKYC